MRVPAASVTLNEPLIGAAIIDASLTVSLASPSISKSTLGATASRMPSVISDASNRLKILKTTEFASTTPKNELSFPAIPCWAGE